MHNFQVSYKKGWEGSKDWDLKNYWCLGLCLSASAFIPSSGKLKWADPVCWRAEIQIWRLVLESVCWDWETEGELIFGLIMQAEVLRIWVTNSGKAFEKDIWRVIVTLTQKSTQRCLCQQLLRLAVERLTIYRSTAQPYKMQQISTIFSSPKLILYKIPQWVWWNTAFCPRVFGPNYVKLH